MKLYLVVISIFFNCLLFADTKGLNQIVTPSITPFGVFTYSFQFQNVSLGNGLQSQLEFGIGRDSEIAYWQGYQPNSNIIALEHSFYNKNNIQISAGSFYVFDNRTYQPFVCASYTKGNSFYELGTQIINKPQSLIGYQYNINDKFSFVLDYMSGKENYKTIGFNYNITSSLQLNPALYISNSSGRIYPYCVLTYTFTI